MCLPIRRSQSNSDPTKQKQNSKTHLNPMNHHTAREKLSWMQVRCRNGDRSLNDIGGLCEMLLVCEVDGTMGNALRNFARRWGEVVVRHKSLRRVKSTKLNL